MKPTYQQLYLVVEALELLKATWLAERERLDEERDDDRLGELGNDLALLEMTLTMYSQEKKSASPPGYPETGGRS